MRLFRLFAVSSLAGYEVPAASPRRCGEAAHLYHNNRDGTFTEVSSSMGINGPYRGFPCWAWDYDNDDWLDIFATSYDHTLGDIGKGLLGQPTAKHYNKHFRNMGGRGFEDRTREAGLDMAFAAMGSNYGDFDNDGFLDMNLGTGDPNLATLVPNRMFKNIAGERFADVTYTSSIHRHVSSGGSFGANPLQQTNGLARAERVALLEVHWPTSGTTQVSRNIAADQAIEVTEFAADYRALGWTPTPAPKSASSLRPARPADLLPKPGMAREWPGRRDEGPGAG